MTDTETETAHETGRRLFSSPEPDDVRAVVLMLHGGAPTGRDPVGPRSASLWRSEVMRRALAPRLREAGVAVHLLRYCVRGWNATSSGGPSPVADARWALDQLAGQHPGLPVVLLGHSMGGRTAVHVAQHPAVRGVVGLAPWLDASDPVRGLADRHLVVGHGSRDKITSARRSRLFVERATPVASSSDFVDLGRLGHYMLARTGRWNRFAHDAATTVLERSGVALRHG